MGEHQGDVPLRRLDDARWMEAMRTVSLFLFLMGVRPLKRLILASQSPRRLHLLNQIGFKVEVIPSSAVESFDVSITPEENAQGLALAKAKDVGARIENGIVIGADTIVVVNGESLGKPTNARDAIAMLEKLSGRMHSVITGFALLDRPSNKFVTGAELTHVTFRSIPRDEIERYVAGGSPMDKAGAYGIQDDYGAVFVSRVEGCFYNVVGFPLARFYTAFQEFTALIESA